MTLLAQRILEKFGGTRPLATAIDKAPSTVDRWRASGFINEKYEPLIVDAAAKNGIALEQSDYVQPLANFASED